MGPRVRGILVAGYAALSMLFLFLVQLPAMLLTRTGDFSIWLARHAWSPSALWLAGVDMQVRADARLPPGPAIYVSNHESALDIWVLFRAIPRNVRFIAKRELLRIPVFGWYLALARFILVDRKDHARAVAALRRAGDAIRGGLSVIVFAEGTRSTDGRVHGFKKGGFVVAMEAGVPVVPVAISGSSAVTPKRRLEVHPGDVRVAIGEALDPRAFEDKTALLREVRRRIIELHLSLGGLGGDAEAAVAPAGEQAG